MADVQRLLTGVAGLLLGAALLQSCTEGDDADTRGARSLPDVAVRHVDASPYPIVYAQQDPGSGSVDLYLTTAEGGTPVRFTEGSLDETMPAWSPDGSRIAFMATESLDQGPSDIYVVGADGRGLRRLTRPGQCAAVPSWSPDGEALLYQAGCDGEGNPSIFVMTRNGKRSRILVPGPAQWPRWSSGGRIVYEALVGDAGDSALFVADSDGSDRTVLDTGALPSGTEASWSPAGNQVAYVAPTGTLGDSVSCDQWNEDIFVVDADGTGGRRVVRSAGNDHWPPAWSPDGRRLLYTADEPGNCRELGNLTLVDLETLRLEPLFKKPCQCLFPSWRH